MTIYLKHLLINFHLKIIFQNIPTPNLFCKIFQNFIFSIATNDLQYFAICKKRKRKNNEIS